MNSFERVAIFTVIDNIESQIRGLKTLIAASNAGAMPDHKVTMVQQDPTSNELSEQEDDMLEKQLLKAREEADTLFKNQWAEVEKRAD